MWSIQQAFKPRIPFRTAKLNDVGVSEYYGGWPHGKRLLMLVDFFLAIVFFFHSFFLFFRLFPLIYFFLQWFWKLLFAHFVSHFSRLNRCLYCFTSEMFLSECCIYLMGWFGLSIDQKVGLVCHISKPLVSTVGWDNHFRRYGLWR